MSPLVLILIICASVFCNEVPEQKTKESAREEKLRSALIDAFQNIKKASAKGGFDDEGPLTSDLIGSVNTPNKSRDQKTTTEDAFDIFGEDDGLSFADAFGNVQTEKRISTTEKAHNVQHIVKTTKHNKDITTAKSVISTKVSEALGNTVNDLKKDLLTHKNETLLGMVEMLRVFDADILVSQWNEIQGSVSGECKQDMQDYVDGLTERELWALKMDDASGRYTTMFYWGNNYWTGSAELCQILNQQAAPANTTNKTKKSQIFSDWRDDVSMSGAGPPFLTAFYSLRITLTTQDHELIKTSRTVHLGACLPYSCGRAGVAALVEAARGPLLQHHVVTVRAPFHGEYIYTEDPTFIVLACVCSIVGVLLVVATLYDLKLARDVRRRRQRAHNLAADAPAAAHLKLHLGSLDGIAVANGKSLYNMNNNSAMGSNSSEERLTTDSVTTDEEIKLSMWEELLLSFSVKANLLQILDGSVGSDTVSVVHGLRSLSMLWVIFGHTCIVVFKYADNTALRAVLEKSFWFQLVISAVYSVDTFFCLGGMLVTFLYFRSNAKGSLDRLTKGHRKSVAALLQFLGLIGYRFARLTAPYLFMLGVVEVTMKWFHYNAVFEAAAADHETCPKYWWRNVLYINTLFPVDQMCMLWSWYLSDDTQFYAVSGLLLILAISHPRVSAGLTGLLFLLSLGTTGYVSYASEHIPNADDPFTQFDKIYDKPWTRFGPYLAGMITGWILFKTNMKIQMGRVWATVGWVVSICTFLFLIFGLYRTELGVLPAAVYSALSHSLWAASVGWVIIACSTGYGGWIHSMLSAPVLYPFSRVTYCAYLVHPVVMRVLAMHLTHPIHLDELLVIILYLGLTVVSYFLAFLVSIAFEAPIVTMLKIVAPQKKPHRV